jgi:Peptidase family S41/N-terminal domain of Peptidase_S41 in eukaryotic IRBP
MTDLLDASTLVDRLRDRLADSYVFPERAAAAGEALRANLRGGRYGARVDEGLCERLNEDLFEICRDKHLRLIWHPTADGGEPPRSEEELMAGLRTQFRLENQGVRRVERLPGNVGSIRLTIIPPAESAGASIAAAMELVRETQALIVDLCETRGGAPDGVALWCSYFLADGDVHLNDVVEGPHGPTRQYWTSGYLPAPRYSHRPVYALVSSATFSGGEELAYNLKVLGRATIVGEVTRGGAHPSAVLSLGEHVELRLPVARTVNPVTGGNWEEVGVEPDIRASAAEAFDVAYRTILESLGTDGVILDA